MFLGVEYFESLWKTTWQVLDDHIYFSLNSLEEIVTGGNNCDALAEVTKTSSQWLIQQGLSRTHRTGGPQIGGVSNVMPTTFISLHSFSSTLLLVLVILSCGLKITVVIKGLDGEKEWSGGGETERQRKREWRRAWISLKGSEFSPSKLLEDQFICFTGHHCLNSANL